MASNVEDIKRKVNSEVNKKITTGMTSQGEFSYFGIQGIFATTDALIFRINAAGKLSIKVDQIY